MTRWLVITDTPDNHPHNWAGRDVEAGEAFPEFMGCTYGSCDQVNGVVLESPEGSYFEFPRSAVVKDVD